jgi:hypothetical protein
MNNGCLVLIFCVPLGGGVIFFFIAKPVHNFVQNYKIFFRDLLHFWNTWTTFRYK